MSVSGQSPSPRRSPSLASLLNPTPDNEPPFFRRPEPSAGSPSLPGSYSSEPISPGTVTGKAGPSRKNSFSIGFLTGPSSDGAAAAKVFNYHESDPGPAGGAMGKRPNGAATAAAASAGGGMDVERQRSSPGSTSSGNGSELPLNPRKRPRTADSPSLGGEGALPPPSLRSSAAAFAHPSQPHRAMPPPDRPASASRNGKTRASASPSFITGSLPSPAMPPGVNRRMSGSSGPGAQPGLGPGPGSIHSPSLPDEKPVLGYPVETRREERRPEASSRRGSGDSHHQAVAPNPSATLPQAQGQGQGQGQVPPYPPAPAHPSPPHPHHPRSQQPSPSQQQGPLVPPPPLEPSIFTVAPLDEFTVEVGEWIWAWVGELWARGDGHLVEIEAKIGVLIDTRTGFRLAWPVACETPLTDTTGIRFESNMSEAQHKSYNNILNKRVEESRVKGYDGARVEYSHRYEMDEFHTGHKGVKVRVTKDSKSGHLVEDGVIIKERIADMNVFSPKRPFDYRISISLEQPTQMPNSKANHRRYKDRISYAHQLCQVDLTQVKTDNPAEEPRHELEVEFTSAPALLQEAQRDAAKAENVYHDMLQVFLNNVRMLVRNAGQGV